MKRLLWTALLCGCFAIPAYAEDTPSPETLRAAQDLAGIMTGDTVQRMSAAMSEQMWPRIESQFATKVDATTIAELKAEFQQALTAYTSDVMKDAPTIYAHYFTAQELRDLIAFYKTPVGAKSLQVLPQISADVAAKMVPRLQVFQTALSGRFDAVMEKHGYKK